MLFALIPPEQPRPAEATRPWVVAAAVVVAVGLNTIAAVAGAQAGVDDAPTLVDPAGYAFGIWGVIFVANLVFAVYQATPAQRSDGLLDRVAYPFVAGQCFAALFAVAALIDSLALAQASTLLYFAATVVTYAVLGVGQRTEDTERGEGWRRRLAAWLPASMSMAWLLAASIVVLASVLQHTLEVTPPLGDGEDWAAVAIGSAAVIAVLLLVRRRDFVFAAVTAWALIGISQEQTNEVVDTAVVAAVAVIALVAIGVVPRGTTRLPWRHTRRHAGAH